MNSRRLMAIPLHLSNHYRALVNTAMARPSLPSLGFLLIAVVIVSVLPSTLKNSDLIAARPTLIPRDFDLVGDLITFHHVGP